MRLGKMQICGCADFKYVKCGCCCGWKFTFYPHTQN